MGNFEKLSVVVIVVIIVMILAVAVVEWTSTPSEAPPTEPGMEKANVPPTPSPEPAKIDKPKIKHTTPKPPSATEVDPLDRPWDPWINPKDDGKGAKTDTTEPKSLLPGDKGDLVTPPAPAPATTTPDLPESSYVVKEGDMLSTIAQTVWGKSSLWPLIAEANPSVRPESLRKGETLKIPARKGVAIVVKGPAASGTTGGTKPVPGKEYTVQANDTWERISLAAYNTSARWPEIYIKNADRFDNMKDLGKGKVIMIPK